MTAFLLTWKESGWPYENIVRMVNEIEANGHVDEPWRIVAHNLAKRGDRVWVLKQGRGPKGVFGVGEITGPPTRGEAGNGKIQWMAPIRFNAFVDPKQQLLIDEKTVSTILRPNQLNAQASGYPLDDEQSDALDTVLASTPTTALGGSGDWTSAEIQAIVDDYFSMLDDELAGRPFSKAEHRNALRRIVKRSPGSIERKHHNISAVLNELGLPWIGGYKPLSHFQDALVKGVELRLQQSIGKIEHAATNVPHPGPINLTSVFVSPPQPKKKAPTARAIESIVKKFDPALRDAANQKLGTAGEEFVLRVERERLTASGKSNLAKKVAWVSKDVGDGLGYDIASYTDDGSQIYIEVKATKGAIDTPFFITENERRVATSKGPAFRLYRVFSYGKEPKIYTLTGPLESALKLEPMSYRASIAPADR
jgi:Domain of unknown function (DUF3883)